MADALRRFVARAPRYLLRPSDNQMLRYAPNGVQNRTWTTRFINVSETGLAFLTDRSSAPRLGELIKLEFTVPGAEQIAWFARVVRLEEVPPKWASDDSNQVIVGVRFHELPDHHRQAIRDHLRDKFEEILLERKRQTWRTIRAFMSEHGTRIALYVIATLLTFGLLYFLTLPIGNYDPKRGAPWGERFK